MTRSHRCHVRPVGRAQLRRECPNLVGVNFQRTRATRCYCDRLRIEQIPPARSWWRRAIARGLRGAKPPAIRWMRLATLQEVWELGPGEVRRRGLLPPVGGGAAKVWTAAAAGNYSTAGNWTGGTIPVAGDTVQWGSGAGATQSNCTIDVTTAKLGSVDFTGYTGTLTLSTAATTTLVVGGNVTFSSTMTTTFGQNGQISVQGVCAWTSAGKTFTISVFMDTGANCTFQDAYSGGSLVMDAGTLNFNGQAVTLTGALSTPGTVARTLTLGASTITLSGTGTVWSMSTGGTLTVNAGTSTIVLSNTTATAKTFAGASKTYNNISLTGGGTGAVTFTGSNTISQLTVNRPKTVNFTAGSTQTITTLVATGASGSLIVLQSATASSTATISSTTQFSGDWLTVVDITAAGAVPFIAGANSTLTRTVNWVNALITNSDSATGADAAQIAASGSEAAAGTEASALTLRDSETHSGAETAALALGGADSGGGGEAGGITLAAADAAAGGESGRLAFSGADQGSGGDAAALMLLATEAGSGGEGVPRTGLVAGDTAVAGEAAQLWFAGADQGASSSSESLALLSIESALGGEGAGLWLAAVEDATGSDAERVVFLAGDQGTGASSETLGLSESETAGAGESTAVGLGAAEGATGTEADRPLYVDADGGSGTEDSAPMGVAGFDAGAALEAWGGRAIESSELAAGGDGQSLTLDGVEVGFSADGGAVVVLSGDAGDSTGDVALAVFSSDEGTLTAVLVLGLAEGDHAGGLDVGAVQGLVLIGVGSSLGLTGIAAPIGRL